MDDYCSPQWVDFTSPSDVPSDDFFDIDHDISNLKLIETVETNLNVIKNTPIKVICPPSSAPHSNTKHQVVKEVTYNDVMQEAGEIVQNCLLSKSDIFKKPVTVKNQISKSLTFQTVDNNQVSSLLSTQTAHIKEDSPEQEIKILSPPIIKCDDETKEHNDEILQINSDESNQKLRVDNHLVFYTPDNSKKQNTVNKQRLCKSLEKNSNRRRSNTLTFNCRRQSIKFHKNSNRYISLAAAVLRYQNQTPERFHTRSNKDIKLKTASSQKQTSVSRKSMIAAKSNLQRRSAFQPKEETESMPDKRKECSAASEMTKSRRSCPSTSTRKTTNNKHVISTIVQNNGSEIVIKKEKILFFDIPIHAKQKTTSSTPFSFENRDKKKRQSKYEKSQLKDNKSPAVADAKLSVKAVKPSNNQKKTSCMQKRTSSTSNLKNEVQLPVHEVKKSNKQLQANRDVCKPSKVSNGMLEEMPGNKNKDIKRFVPTVNINRKETDQLKQSSLKSYKKSENQHKFKSEQLQNKETSQEKKQSSKMKPSPLSVSSTNSQNKTGANIQDGKILKASQQCMEQENKHPIGMNSYERAKYRREYDEKIRQKISMQEEQRQKEEAQRLAKEKLQIAMLRKQQEVKANPMPVFKPILPIRSNKPLTVPHSPAWAHKNKKQIP